MATSAQILTRLEGVTKISKDTIGIPGAEDTQLFVMLNAANNEWVEAFKVGAGEPPQRIKKEGGGTIVASTDLDGAVATTDTTVDVTSATDLDSSGAIVVYDGGMPDTIEYTGVSTNQLTGVTGIGFAHSDADQVVKLYALPSDFDDLRSAEGFGDGVRVNNTNYEYTSGVPSGSQFSLYDNGTTTYLWFPLDSSGDFSVLYNKNSTTIDDSTDTVDIPDSQPHNQLFLVYRLAEYLYRDILSIPDKAQGAKNLADTILSRELKKQWINKRPKLLRSANQLNASAEAGSRVEYYSSKAGATGFSL